MLREPSISFSLFLKSHCVSSKDDVEKMNSIGRELVKLLDVSEADGIGLEFQVSTSLYRRIL